MIGNRLTATVGTMAETTSFAIDCNKPVQKKKYPNKVVQCTLMHAKFCKSYNLYVENIIHTVDTRAERSKHAGGASKTFIESIPLERRESTFLECSIHIIFMIDP